VPVSGTASDQVGPRYPAAHLRWCKLRAHPYRRKAPERIRLTARSVTLAARIKAKRIGMGLAQPYWLSYKGLASLGETLMSYPGPSLPATTTHNWEWQIHAACRGLGDEYFFPADTNERGRYKLAREQTAKSICASCPVSGACLAWALGVGEMHGIWGGLTATERRQLTASDVPPIQHGSV
jgi:WhiB family redox-sensing transcriptional regulator